MRNYILSVMTVGFMSLALLMGCSQTSEQEIAGAKANVAEMKKDVKDAVANQHEATREVEWLKFKGEAELKIAANDKSIAAYKVSMTGTDGTRRANYNKKIDALEVKNKELRVKLENYPEFNKTDWEQFKNEFSRDMDELGASLKDFVVNNEK